MIDSGTLLQNRFLIEAKIGSGGMGAVYSAIDQKFGSRVAVKQTFYGDPELAAAFEREARLLNGLHHSILPHVSDSFSEDGGHFLVMEFIEGEDLSELLKRGEAFTVDTVVDWAFELLDGLDYLHSQNPPVIHRDIKPNNLKLTSRGKIILLDFGMAKDTSSNTLEARSVFGYSRRYSPLEQIEGTGTDARSDIFSLGASLYHLISGKPPADVLARASAIVAGKRDPLIPANLVDPSIPESVSAVLDKALALNAEHRFESARAMSEALKGAMSADLASQNKTDGHAIALPQSDFVPAQTAVLASAPLAMEIPAVSEFDLSPSRFSDETFRAKSTAATAAETPEAFTTNSAVENFRNRMRGSIPQIRVRKPSRASYAVWLPILLLCLGGVFLGTYLASGPGDEEASTETTTPAVSENPDPQVLATPQSEEIAESAPQVIVDSKPKAQPAGMDENAIELRKGPVADREDVSRREVPDRPAETKVSRGDEQNVVRTPGRLNQKRSSANERASKRIVKPAFEQPRVSSIEAIMTGRPDETRNRWEYERDSWNDEELRRRRARRNRRYQQPF